MFSFKAKGRKNIKCTWKLGLSLKQVCVSLSFKDKINVHIDHDYSFLAKDKWNYCFCD